MSRIFLSHSNADKLKAVALKRWLVEQNPPLDNDIFLDIDRRRGIRLGDRWKEVIQQKGEQCQVMVCMVSEAWEASPECTFEFAIAERWKKRILSVRLEPSAGQGIADFQWVDLFGDGPQTEIKFDHDDEEHVVTFPTRGLRRLRDEVVGHGIGADTFVWPPPDDPNRAPYRGWAALDEFDAAVYFGRDPQIVRALDALRKMRSSEEETLFVILGPSGSGKSSFLRAGLLPRLRRDDTNYVVLDIVRPERSVLTGENGLANSLNKMCERLKIYQLDRGDIKQACLQDADRVGQLLSEIRRVAMTQLGEAPDGKAPEDGAPEGEAPESAIAPVLVLPVDQAEELFGVDAGDEAPRFLELIGRYARTEIGQRVPLIVVVTIRTDHHEKLQTAPQLSAVKSVLFDDLKPLPEAQFKDVIEGPARRASESGRSLHIEPALVERLLKESTKGAGTLPLLSLTLARLYQDYSKDGLLELREYLAMGEMRNVVQTEVNEVLAGDAAKRRGQLELLREAFVPGLATINPDNDLPVRRVALWDEFEPDVKDLLDEFVGKRLLVKDSRESGDVVEVALESLLQHWEDLKGWLEEEREDLKLVEILTREATAWENNQRDDAWLLHGRRLDDAEKLFARADYEDHISGAREFVDASRNRSRRRKTLLWSAVAVVAVVALVAAFSLYRFFQSSQQTTAWRLLKEAEQMLEGGRAGGDVRALKQQLAAISIEPNAEESVADAGRELIKILENPPRTDGVEGGTPVRSVAVNPGGDRIAWANDDKTVRVWDARTNEIQTLLTRGTYGSKAVAFSPDGKWLAVGGSAADGSSRARLLLWNTAGLDSPPAEMPHAEAVWTISFNQDSTLIATGTTDGKVHVWDTTGKPKFTFAHEPGSEVKSVAFSPGGLLVASGGTDKTVRLWNVQTGQEAGPRYLDPAEDDAVTAVAYSPKGDRIVIARADGLLQLLDGTTLAPRSAPLQAHPNNIDTVAFSPNGSRIVTGGGDNTVRVWDAATNDLVQIGNPLLGHHGPVSCVVFSSNGAWIVSGGMDGSVRVWDAVKGVPIPAKQGEEIRAVAFSPDGTQIASGGTLGTVRLWKAATGEFLYQLGELCQKDVDCAVNTLAFHPTQPRIVTGSRDGVVRVWDLTNPRQVPPPLEMRRPAEVPLDAIKRIRSVAFSPNGSVIVAAGLDGVVRLWDAQSLAPRAEVVPKAKHKGKDVEVRYQVWSAAFNQDGTRLATGSGYDLAGGSDSSFLQLWTVDLNRVQPLVADGDPIIDHDGWNIFSVAFDAGGERVASSSYDGTVRIFDVEAPHTRRAVLSSDQNAVLSIAFARDKPWLVAGGTDGMIRLWDTSTNEPIGTPLTGHRGWVHSVAFSDNDETILSGSADGNVRLWASPQDLTHLLCEKLTTNMSHEQWDEWVAGNNWLLRYQNLCPDLPDP